MESFLQMDIFFFVTTLVVSTMGVLGSLVLYLLVRILWDIRDITQTIKKEAVEIAEDFTEVRTEIKEGVHEVRENVNEGVKTAKTYTKAIVGAGVIKAVSNLMESFTEEKVASKKRAAHKKKKKAQ